MSYAVDYREHYTYDDWVGWEGKWELIGGFPVAMSPAPVPNHQRIAINISAQFVAALKNCGECIAYLPIDYVVSNDTILQPDMLVVCGEIKKPYLDFPPSLVVEILSPATTRKDRTAKFKIYQSQGVKFYLIIDHDKESVEVYELVDEKYELKMMGKNFSYDFTFQGCAAQINFKEIW